MDERSPLFHADCAYDALVGDLMSMLAENQLSSEPLDALHAHVETLISAHADLAYDFGYSSSQTDLDTVVFPLTIHCPMGSSIVSMVADARSIAEDDIIIPTICHTNS